MADYAHDIIAEVAYSFWEEDGSPPGEDKLYWFRAVDSLKTKALAARDSTDCETSPDPLHNFDTSYPKLESEMKSLECQVRAVRPIKYLFDTRPQFSKWQGKNVSQTSASRWRRGRIFTNDIQIIIIGKSGQGKSSLLNRLVGEDLFESSAVEACTMEMQSVEYDLHGGRSFLSFADLPGLGEERKADRTYFSIYKNAVDVSHLIIYVIKADHRDFGLDIEWLKRLKKTIANKPILFAITAIDKIEPISRSTPFVLGDEQIRNIVLKKESIGRLFGVQPEDIFAISALENLGFEDLCERICSMLDRLFV